MYKRQIFTVSNIIKLTVFARREQIEIMRLVGATDRFIETPFIFEGVIHGFVGSVIAYGLLYLFYSLAQKRFHDLFFPEKWIFLGLVIFGSLLGLVGSIVAVRRYLRRPAVTPQDL